jgi:prepilin-type N-terminal cleavage/methylation domain-containing protein
VRIHLKDERGFTLPEMMVTIMIMIVVLFALYSIFDMSIRVFDFGNDKVEAVENARLGLEKMEREIRAAYPYNPGAGKGYVLLNPGDPTQKATSLLANQITFGNELNGDDKLSCPISLTDTRCEFITYKLSGSAPYTLQRVNTATPSTSAGDPVVEFVNGSGGLTFTYLKPDANGNLVTTTNVDEVKVVRARLQISKDGRVQNLTTDITLRNRSF